MEGAEIGNIGEERFKYTITQHHSRGVESTAVVESPDSWVLPHDGFVVGGERLWTAAPSLVINTFYHVYFMTIVP